MSDPYTITEPSLISFSGGRTSAYMLKCILDANGGALPANCRVCFANTGKERAETLDFVAECSRQWGVHVNWLEWRAGRPGYESVNHNSASRNGEPFEQLIRMKKRLPNGHERWCTQYLKVLPMFAFMRDSLGMEPGQYTEIIGLRDDEGLRIFKGLARAESDGRVVRYPLARAKVSKSHVMNFWRSAPFDLGLQPWEGNCDLCFLKGKGIRKRIIRDEPARANWWKLMEQEQSGWFDKRDLVSELADTVDATPELFDIEYDAECDLVCG